MKQGENLVILIGNVGQDPETRFFPDGGAITNVSLATSEKWKDKQSGEDKEKTEWHRLVFRDRGAYKLGAIAGEHIVKGTKLYVNGRLQTRTWDKDGTKMYTTEIMVNEFQFIGPKSDQAPARKAPQDTSGNDQHHNPGGDFGSFEDDIPF